MDKIFYLQTKVPLMATTSQKSLISSGMRKEKKRIIMENFNMAKRMINLPPVIKTK
jgi:hypothetical protein